MKVNTTKKYQSKLLIFGEHAILKGSQALAMPLPVFYGHWAYSADVAKQLNLGDFADYLNQHFPGFFDISALQKELRQGLFFNSNIPTGYGVGSSGALVAAIFDTFGKDKNIGTKQQLQAFFGKMESFFHGSSSGIDPLICYLEDNILLEGTTKMASVTLPDFSTKGDWTIFLLDTKMPRKTGTFVNIFLEKCQDVNYQSTIERGLNPLNRAAIANFLNGKWAALFDQWHLISEFQEQHFAEMIPAIFKPIWARGLAGDSFRLKVCGAGGGGFLLGMTRDFVATKLALADWDLKPVFGK